MPRRLAALAALVSLAVVVGACASSGGTSRGTASAAVDTTAVADPVAAASFAPSLGVDLGAMRRTRRGVYLRDRRLGDGPVASSGSSVRVRYAGWLADGTSIDSAGAGDASISFVVGRGQTIAGWDDGVPGMRAGGRRQLVVPPELAYGANGEGRVPPNAVLVFTIDLVDAR